MPPPFPVIRARLDRALELRDLAAVRAVARDHRDVITLRDAIEVLVMMVDADDDAFEAAAVRWIARFAGESSGVTLGEVLAALESIEGLPAQDARATMIALVKRHGADRAREC